MNITWNNQIITATTNDTDGDIVQTGRYNNKAGQEIPVKDFLIDGTHVIASTAPIARALIRATRTA